MKLRLNLGCGEQKLEGFINVDSSPSVKPDQLFDLRGEFPLDDNSCELIVMYHTIEHIPKCFWQGIFLEASRMLEPEKEFWISFPEASVCFEYWKTNHRGNREFWEACIFGRGLTPEDRHVALADSKEIKLLLEHSGFEVFVSQPEPDQPQYSLIKARNKKPLTYEEVLKDTVWHESSTIKS